MTNVGVWLLLQHISLVWDKSCRGGQAAVVRNGLPRSYMLTDCFFDHPAFSDPTEAIPYHVHMSRQQVSGVTSWSGRRIESALTHVGRLEIRADNDKFCLEYHDRSVDDAWDAESGNYGPLRHIIPVELGRYARVSWNARMVSWDDPWYEWHIVNAIAVLGPQAPLDVFLREPDTVYEKMSMLP